MAGLRIIDVLDAEAFAHIPPCADPRFDHRTCDYWEDADRGSRQSRPAWLTPPTPVAHPSPPPDNPFAPPTPGIDRRRDALAALLGGAPERDDPAPAAELGGPGQAEPLGTPGWNPFAPAPSRPGSPATGLPRKLALLTRGETVFGSYARVAIEGEEPVAYAQFGPLSAYPRAQRLRDLYPQLPAAPLPAVITCIATTSAARGRGHARRLVQDVCEELARRGFAAVEVYPDLTRPTEETSAATPAFWLGCGFALAVADDRFPVLRRELS
jgi:ribosomal protein S18 acetylase RimI-like enzyme